MVSRQVHRPRARLDPRAALAVALLAVAVASLLGYVALVRDGVAVPRDEDGLSTYLILAAFLVYAAVGTGILVRRPANAVGWLVGAIGFFPLVGNAADEYVARAVVSQQTDSPLLGPAQWWSGWYFFTVLGLMPLLFLLFPDGQPVSRSARHVVRLAGLGLGLVLLLGMLGPSGDPDYPNPYAVPLPRSVVVAAEVVLVPALLVPLLAGLVSLGVRYRRARGVERQQVTCLLYAAVLSVLLLFASSHLPGDWAFPLGLVLPALGVGAAVMRYRLYDIDRLVSRTITYALLSGLLALPYVVVVTGASRLGGGNSATVVLATLAAAAAFSPLRRRIQDRVDRRFNRSRYDATRTVQAFTARLRQEVELDTVSTDLLAVVHATVQPSTASLWLRSPPPVGAAP